MPSRPLALLADDPELAALERYRTDALDDVDAFFPGLEPAEPAVAGDLELLAVRRDLDPAEWGRAP